MTVVEEYIDNFTESSGMSRYEAAEHVRGVAQSVMNEERPRRIEQLRKIATEGEAAAKELVELGAVGAPRKTAKKRASRKKTEAVAG